jgi:membrane carboxypeptidase/penicillin-binding protein
MRKPLIILAKLVLALLSVAGMGLLIVESWLIWHYEYCIGLPDESKLAALPSTDRVCSTDGHGIFVPLADIPPRIRMAVVAFEDPDFYERPSVGSLPQLVLAMVSTRGPSTRSPWSNITQSVTRNCLRALSPECCRGIDWHIGNVVFMGRVEHALSRDRILEIYLNDTYFGRSAYGVASAAEVYFGKPLAELDVGEIAFMIVRARSPHPSKYFDTKFRDFAIDRMLKGGIISEAEAVEAKGRPILLKESSTDVQDRPNNP